MHWRPIVDGSQNPISIYVPTLPEASCFWPLIKPWVDETVGYSAGCYESVDLYRSMLNGELRLWLVIEEGKPLAFAMTRIEKHPRRWLLAVPFIGGNRMTEWWKLLLEQLTTYAKFVGCDGMTGGGREGWGKLAGFKNRGCWLVKDFE